MRRQDDVQNRNSAKGKVLFENVETKSKPMAEHSAVCSNVRTCLYDGVFF